MIFLLEDILYSRKSPIDFEKRGNDPHLYFRGGSTEVKTDRLCQPLHEHLNFLLSLIPTDSLLNFAFLDKWKMPLDALGNRKVNYLGNWLRELPLE